MKYTLDIKMETVNQEGKTIGLYYNGYQIRLGDDESREIVINSFVKVLDKAIQSIRHNKA